MCYFHNFLFISSSLQYLQLLYTINQERATNAIDFGLGMKQNGYNLYVLGPTGSGKRTMVRNFLEERSMSGIAQATCYDWAYVHNFDQPDNPKTIK